MEAGVFALRLAVALALGGLIGFEREYGNHPAGLRTNALVAAGAALFVLSTANVAPADATRVVAQVASGVGFLGGGVILRDGMNVKGLTTAATLWCAAAVGILAGIGMLLPAVMAAVAVVATNFVLHPLSQWISHRQTEVGYTVTVFCDPGAAATVQKTILAAAAEHKWNIETLSATNRTEPPGVEVRASLLLKRGQRDTLERSVADLTAQNGVTHVHWERAAPGSSPG